MSPQAFNLADALLAAALAYAERGWPVLPIHTLREGRCSCRKPDCRSPGKHPMTSRGVHAATTDRDTILEWWGKQPLANIGIRTGEISGLFVIDIDPRNEGDEALDELEQALGALPETLEVLTGGGGRHLYFRYPISRPQLQSKFARGVDIRADDAYVVAPPSLHASGREYCWEASTEELTPVLLPGKWLHRIFDGARARTSTPIDSTTAFREGERNAGLTRLAGGLRRSGLDAEELEAALVSANQRRCVPPLSESEVRSIAQSIGRYPTGSGHPQGDAPTTVTGSGMDSPSDPSPKRERGVSENVSRADRSPETPRSRLGLGSDSIQSGEPQVLSIAELRKDPPAKPQSLIGDGLLIPGGFLLLAGAPGCGKSWAALDLLVASACGLPWLGIPQFPVQPGRTLLVSMELPGYLLHERIEAVARQRNIAPEHPALHDALVLNAPSYAWVGLDTESGAGFLQGLIRQYHLGMLILDPFSRLHSAEENAAKEIGDVLRVVDALRLATGCAIVLIHHVRKGLPGKGRGDLNSIRGSGRLISDPQTVMLLERRQERLCLSTEKINCGPSPEEVWLNMQPTGCLVLTAPPEDRSAVCDANREWTLAQIRAAGTTGVKLSELLERPDHPGVGEATLRRYCRELEEEGLIEKLGDARSTRWRFISPFRP